MLRSTVAFPGEGFSSENFGVAPPPITVDQWTGASGAWEDASNWSQNAVPGTFNTVVINNAPSSAAVTYNSVGSVWSLTSGTDMSLDLQSGWLTSLTGGWIKGTLYVEASATFAVSTGTQYVSKGSIFGTVAGRGTFDMYGGGRIDTDRILVASFEIGVNTSLETNLSYSGNFTILSSPSASILDLGGHNLALRGNATLSGTFKNGTVNIYGSAVIQHNLTLGSAGLFIDAGATVTQQADISGGNSNTSSMTIRAGAIYNISAPGAALGNGFDLTNSGTINIKDNSYVQLNFKRYTSGSIHIDAGSGCLLSGVIGGDIVNDGEFLNNLTMVTLVIGQLTNNSYVSEAGSTLEFRKSILGTGNLVVDSFLQLDAESTSAQKLLFQSRNGHLRLGDPEGFQSSIYQFGSHANQTITLMGFDNNSGLSFASASDGLIVNVADGANSASLHFVGSYNQGGFAINPGPSGEVLTYSG